MLLVDNILDLSHVDYLHPTTLGSGAISRSKATVEDLSPRNVKISWISSGDMAPPAFDMHLRQQGRPTDQWTEVTWTAPSNMMLSVGATLQGEERGQGVGTLNLHLGTPERAGHTHYWYWATRDFAISAEANAFIRPMVENVFRSEDKPMLEAQQSRMGDAEVWSLKPVLLASDAGAGRARRKLAALIEAERGAP
jgi:vanillate O-demethylase monooxygenase subunit